MTRRPPRQTRLTSFETCQAARVPDVNVAAADDWRRRGQEMVLPKGTEFVRRPYTPYSPRWDHDHCAMCWAKFSAAGLHESIAEGYATTAAYPRGGEGGEWVCPECFDDFAPEFGWLVVE